jgi:hypothetical protein
LNNKLDLLVEQLQSVVNGGELLASESFIRGSLQEGMKAGFDQFESLCPELDQVPMELTMSLGVTA